MENTPALLLASLPTTVLERWLDETWGRNFSQTRAGVRFQRLQFVRPSSPRRENLRANGPDRSHPDGIEPATLSALLLGPSSPRRAALDLATVGNSISCHVLNDRRFDRV